MRTLPHGPMGNAPPEYGIDAQCVRVMTLALDTAREKEAINIGGSLFWVIDASSDTATIDFFYRHDQGDGIPIVNGDSIGGIKFNRPLVSHAAQAGEYLTIMYVDAQGGEVYSV